MRLENMAENGDVLKDGMDEPFPSLLGSHKYIRYKVAKDSQCQRQNLLSRRLAPATLETHVKDVFKRERRGWRLCIIVAS